MNLKGLFVLCVSDLQNGYQGRVINNLTVVDDATHEAVAIVPERAISGHLAALGQLRSQLRLLFAIQPVCLIPAQLPAFTQ
ncbi:hypothetical protein FP568_06015 [Pandoraea pnomenusa]|nr:hypothetical protein FP568_06015 [Pandoraea pnomenusa]